MKELWARLLPRLALVSATMSFVVAAFVLAGVLEPEPALVFATVGYPVCGLFAGISLLGGAWRRQGRERLMWSFIASGLLLSIAGFVVYGVLEAMYGKAPYPSIADVLFLGTYGLVITGVLLVPHAEGGRFDRLRLIIDGAIGSGSLVGILTGMVLADTIDIAGLSPLEAIVTVAYPTMDILMLVAVMLMWLRQARSRRDVLLLALALAATFTATADLLFLASPEEYVVGVWYDGLWVVAYGLFSLIAYRLTGPPAVSRPGMARVRVIDVIATYATGFGLLAASAYRLAGTDGVSQSLKLLLTFTGFIVVMAMARQAVALVEHRESVERERRDLVASVSHELRTPLTAIQGFVELLGDSWREFGDDEREECLETVRIQTRALVRIVTDLIEISRGEITSRKLSPEVFELRGALDQAVTASGIDGAKIVEYRVEGDYAWGDRERIIQVLTNFLTNADRYAGGKVAIVTTRTGTDLHIEIHDDGEGVPVQYREQMWERFERAHHRFDAAVPGTGVGLALVRAITEAHGGEVAYADSTLLGGACFIVTIPQRPPLEAA